MRKVAYNACYGGFTLSVDAVRLGRELTGDPKWGGNCIIGDVYDCGSPVTYNYGSSCYDIPRHDDVLIKVIESLGDKASGLCSKIKIEEVEGPYRISEYDGYETVETVDTTDWIL